ncbi:MAG: hypothetical protein JO053_08770 [Acidobacteria bacterium]|nr:hypothetical protein [Acidobacteriota bacterium]
MKRLIVITGLVLASNATLFAQSGKKPAHISSAAMAKIVRVVMLAEFNPA